MRNVISTYRHWLASAAIVTILACQTAGNLLRDNRYWPFHWYPMYAGYRQDGERLNVSYTLYANLVDGRRIQIELGKQFPGDFWYFTRSVEAMLRGRYTNSPHFLRHIQERVPAGIVSLEIHNYPMIITRDGPKEVPSEVFVIPVDEIESARR